MHPGPHPKLENSDTDIHSEFRRRHKLEVDVFAEELEAQRKFIESPSSYLETTKRIPGTNQLEEPSFLLRREWVDCKLWNCFKILGIFTSVPFYSIFMFYGAIGLMLLFGFFKISGLILFMEGVYISREVREVIGDSRFVDDYLFYMSGVLNIAAAIFTVMGSKYRKLAYLLLEILILFASTIIIFGTYLTILVQDQSIEERIEVEIKDYIRKYDELQELDKSLELLQREMVCCGYDKGAEDYKGEEIPLSCCITEEYTTNCSKSSKYTINRNCIGPVKDYYKIFAETESMVLICVLVMNTLYLACGVIYVLISYRHVQVKEEKLDFLEIEKGLKYPAEIAPLHDEGDEDPKMKTYFKAYTRDLNKRHNARKKMRSNVVVGMPKPIDPNKHRKRKLIFNLTTRVHPIPSRHSGEDEFEELYMSKKSFKKQAPLQIPRSASLTNLRMKQPISLGDGSDEEVNDSDKDEDVLVAKFSYNPSTQSIQRLSLDKDYDYEGDDED